MLTLPSYATLINQRLVIPSNKKPFLAIDSHFIQKLLEPWVRRIRFDEAWYIGAYPDVQTAIEDGQIADARTHFCQFGYFEHRRPYSILVDEDWYLAQYADVREAVNSKLFTTGQAHFDSVGYREGRIPWPGFELAMDSGKSLV